MLSPTYVDIHVLQTVPPSNLNRDDAGSPKQAMYGGARRARVSSQAWKRATRTAFAQSVPLNQLGTRTKKISSLVAKGLEDRSGLDAEAAAKIATTLLLDLGIKAGKKATETSYLLFFGRAQLQAIVDLVADRANELAQLDDSDLREALKDLPVKEQLGTGHPIDVALFGRMVADIPGVNVDAATQVAHALSTHAVEVEFDYFTAVDDENPKEDTGAGMIGTVEFNSATLYRYATVGLHQLSENLADDAEATAQALEVFIDSFVRSMPTGHENSFAHRTLPHLVSVVVREDQPVNLVSAFETPVRNRDGIASASMSRLARELQETAATWGLYPASVHSVYRTSGSEDAAALTGAFGESMAFPQMISGVVAAVRPRLGSEVVR